MFFLFRQDLSITWHPKRRFLQLWNAIVTQNVPMERFVVLVLHRLE